MLKRSIIGLSLLFILLVFSSWGDIGHSMISFRINLSFNEEMQGFNDWVFYLSEHSSDADWRKKDDPQEGPKHYIDIDNYSSFVEHGKIPQDLDSCILLYGEEFVVENGTLPWATLASYDSVVNAMKQGRWNDAKKYAADLGHYVADGHMPMHITKNYDGQLSGNKGIHARYEIYMIERYQDQITYTGSPAAQIEDIPGYIFSYLYKNYAYMDSILLADNYATEMGNGNTTDTYYIALWERTENLTIEMFKNASHSLAELLYMAWIDAGRPALNGEPSTLKERKSESAEISISPNPVRNIANVRYSLPHDCNLKPVIIDSSGRFANQMPSMQGSQGDNTFALNVSGLSSGLYFLNLGAPESNYFTAFQVIQ